ncbi:AAA family ATPase [Halanaerobiaceae bacterium Z-7014]|uniref:AAA family ATPase n=1 Tax=Halonatronomonas betaini TaxID=2778430 RepID=A0A931F824_9FIRM|nr:AAA domain-containing protein [Halonatronomonas betaini]MBF8436093.1 AAA family ATPase [Halonatronomonas betaini]
MQNIVENGLDFFNYLEEVIRLSYKTTYNIDEYNNLLLYEFQFKSENYITIEKETELSPPVITIKRPDEPKRPEIPEVLNGWIEFEQSDKYSLPHKINKKLVNDIDEEKQVIYFDDEDERIEVYEKYLNELKTWLENIEPILKTRKIYNQLFKERKALNYQDNIEFVIGYGLVQWHKDNSFLNYPVITHDMTINYDGKSNEINITYPDDSNWMVQDEQLAEFLTLQERESINKIFNNLLNSDSDEDGFKDLLYSLKELDSNAEIKNINNLNSSKISKNLKIFNGWILFTRKKTIVEQIKDIEEFKKEINTTFEINNPILKQILTPPKNKKIDHSKINSHTEWDSTLDKSVLFPKKINQEQVRILDYLEQSQGVVVQGPPGTGKSHTIANLVSHFVASGKRVLVTSEKEQALKVLSDMLPDSVEKLSMTVLSNDDNRIKRLEKVIDNITNIVSNSSEAQLLEEKSNLEKSFEHKKEKLENIKSEMKKLSNADKAVYISPMDQELYPADAQRFIKNENYKYNWFNDFPNYEIEENRNEFEEFIKLHPSSIPSSESLEEALKIRKKIELVLEDLVKYKLPNINKIITKAEFENIAENKYEIAKKESEINYYFDGLELKSNLQVLRESYELTQKVKDIYFDINNTWAIEFIENNKDELDNIESSLLKIKNLNEMIQEKAQKLSFTDSIELNDKYDYKIYQNFINQAIERVENGKNPWNAISLFGLLDKGQKEAVKSVRLNQKLPEDKGEWGKIKAFVDSKIIQKELIVNWDNFAANFVDNNLPEIKIEYKAKKVNSIVDKIINALNYTKTLKNELKLMLSEVIYGSGKSIVDNIENELTNISTVLNLKIENLKLNKSDEKYNNQKKYLLDFKDDQAHPLAINLLKILKKDYIEFKNCIDDWGKYYNQISKLNEDYKKLEEMKSYLEIVKIESPLWYEDWLDYKMDSNKFKLNNWKNAWKFNILKSYLKDIENKNKKMAKLESELKENQDTITKLKEDIVDVTTKISLINNITQKNIRALKSWKGMIKKIGKGYGKYANKYAKKARKYMKEARDSVPAWIMPIYKVSETTVKKMSTFDVVIIDEASQSNVTSLLALLRAKKAIIVGDEKQITPSAVGRDKQKVFDYISKYLKNIPYNDNFDLETSIFELAEIFFGTKSLMLKEHFRCLPEIITFSNELFYQNKIVPLRNPAQIEKLEPVLENIYIREGYRENKVNKVEAKAICEKIQELLQKDRYKNKTFGVISLTGRDQAKYIYNLIDNYISTKDQERIRFHAGDAYDFQGDERDIIILSMVVGGENDNYRALSGKTYEQRVNVATSRAKDKLILFHSVQLGIDLINPDDLRCKLLNYIKNGISSNKVHEDKKKNCDSKFEEDVYDWLVERGYRVTPQVEVGSYKIDLVVEGENNRLAVECDGDRWHPPEKWWDDKLRQQRLERVGWTFWRVSGSNFYANPEQAMSSIIKILNSLNIKPYEKKDKSDGEINEAETFKDNNENIESKLNYV